jgi:hypothetical protein
MKDPERGNPSCMREGVLIDYPQRKAKDNDDEG